MDYQRYTLACCSAVVGMAAAVTANGQESAGLLEEVVVTAQRRAESLEDVPISISVATGEQLEKAGVTKLENIALIAPSVQLSRTGVYTQPSVRGITTTLAGNYENNVAIYVDGYYLPFTRGLNTDLVNIAQLQVLKGPQGTLFGRNATGGAILVQTLDPSLSETSGRVKATYRRYDDKQVQGYFSTPIGDRVAWNIAGSYRESDSYIKDVSGFDTAPIENYNIATKLLWQPTDALSILGKYERMQVSDGRTLATTYEGRSIVKLLSPSTYLETRDNRSSVNFPVKNEADQHTGSVKVTYDFGWAKLASVTSYQREEDALHYDLDGTARRAFEQRTADKNEAFGEDLNLTSSGEGPLQYTIGAYYFDSDLRTEANASLNALPTLAPASYIEGQHSISKTEAFAGYAELTWQAMSKLFLTAGIRYSDETKKLRVVCPALSVGCPLPVFFPNATNPDGEQSFDSWTPRAVVRYQIGDNSNVYASYSQGFKSGFINISTPFNVVDPEEIDAFELGYKIATGRFRLDTAVYFYDYKDLQVSSLQIINNINSAVTTNAATAEIYGAEAQFSASIVRDFNVSLGVAYTHARYTDFKNASYNEIGPTGLNTTTCANAAPPPATVPCVQDWTDEQLIRAPDWTGNVGADYTLDSGAGKFVFAGNFFYTSSYTPLKGDLYTRGASAGSYRYGEDGYTLINASVSYSPPNLDALTITALGENLGDSKYYFYRSGNTFGDYHVLGQPRTWGVSLDYRF